MSIEQRDGENSVDQGNQCLFYKKDWRNFDRKSGRKSSHYARMVELAVRFWQRTSDADYMDKNVNYFIQSHTIRVFCEIWTRRLESTISHIRNLYSIRITQLVHLKYFYWPTMSKNRYHRWRTSSISFLHQEKPFVTFELVLVFC